MQSGRSKSSDHCRLEQRPLAHLFCQFIYLLSLLPLHSQDGTTPLILAAAGGHIHCVLELLEQGAELNSRRSTGTTALFFAAQGGHLDVVRILLKARAKVDIPSLDGGTPLFVAAQGGHVKIIRELLDCGADVNACMKVNQSFFSYFHHEFSNTKM